MAKPTISDLAKAAGVSPTTVSHAFSGRRHVEPETRERIQAMAREIGYHPSKAAQSLRSGKTGTIALVSSMPFAVAAGPSRLGFLMEIAASAAMSAFSREIALCLIPPQPSQGELHQMDFDGVILVEPERDDPLLRHFEERRTPVVAIGRVPDRDDIPAIDLQSRTSTALLLDHLRENGAKEIALVTGASARTSHLDAREIYGEHARKHGFTPRVVLLGETEGEAGAQAAVRNLLERHPGIDGLLVPVDAFATGAVAAAHQIGRDIPRDLRIVTRYDGLRAKLSDPPLSAIDLHLPVLSELAVELLLSPQPHGQSRTATPLPTIIARTSSCGCG